jgi:hypothetical protein
MALLDDTVGRWSGGCAELHDRLSDLVAETR